MLTVKTFKEDFPIRKNKKKIKVLICAGGGLFGYIITYLMSHLDFDLYSKVDVVSGSSIGGILTLAYSVNSDYKLINYLFEHGAAKIFDKRFLGGIIGPKYDNKELENFIENIVGDYKLSDINKICNKDLKLIVPTLDYTLTQPRIFTNIDLEYAKEYDYPLKKIGIATAAAPTYFPAVEYIWNEIEKNYEKMKELSIPSQIYYLTQQAMKFRTDKSVLIDSGVIENIPVITTYTTLKSRYGINVEDIDMFIIGTGDDCSHPMETAKDVTNWTAVDWLVKFIIPYVTESNELASVNFGAQMGFNSFEYYNPLTICGDMDDPNILPTLKKQCDTIVGEFKSEIQAFLER